MAINQPKDKARMDRPQPSIESLEPRVLLIDSNESTSSHVKAEIARSFNPIAIYNVYEDPLSTSSIEIDVCLIHLSDDGTEDLPIGVEYVRRCGCEAVFWADTQRAPQVQAARALGIRRIVPADSFLRWIQAALTTLVNEARAKRLLLRAQCELPPIPSWTIEESTHMSLSLPVAETLFRESYVRSVLADTKNRSEAALVAGVPYRTFCDILNKLNIR